MSNRRKPSGTVYLIHFDRPYRHAGHYLGFVAGGETEVAARLERHRAGDGARLMAVVTAAGIGWRLARTWPGYTRSQERKLKCWNGAGRMCPVCREARRKPEVS